MRSCRRLSRADHRSVRVVDNFCAFSHAAPRWRGRRTSGDRRWGNGA
ncbi:hypothetical protein ACFPRL_10965 [Pseudoclavibacter helvolus]